jgi:hypothetical protein
MYSIVGSFLKYFYETETKQKIFSVPMVVSLEKLSLYIKWHTTSSEMKCLSQNPTDYGPHTSNLVIFKKINVNISGINSQ